MPIKSVPCASHLPGSEIIRPRLKSKHVSRCMQWSPSRIPCVAYGAPQELWRIRLALPVIVRIRLGISAPMTPF